MALGPGSKKYDTIVIGGGPSGMMAAIAAAEQGGRVLLLEKNAVLGKKLALTGGGRCNLTNSKPIGEIIENIPGNGRFLHSALNRWDNQDIMAFFEGLGVELKEEDQGRIFPCSDDSQTIIAALERRLTGLQVDVSCGMGAKKVLSQEGVATGVELSSGVGVESPSVIVATGGKSFSSTGSSGDGYEFARILGHTVTPLTPGEVPLTSNDAFTDKNQLQGVSLQDVVITTLNAKGKKVVTQRGDLLFTHFGLSGPAALRSSTFMLNELANNGQARMSLDILPAQTLGEVTHGITVHAKTNGAKTLKNGLRSIPWESGFLPERLLQYFLANLGFDCERKLKTLTTAEIQSLAAGLKDFTVNITGSLPLDKAFVTCGGVAVKEVDPKTMESKRIRGLYFCGEVLDINGYTGGFNLTSAFTTGHLAGLSAQDRLAPLRVNYTENNKRGN
jgi:predicted Rossmann fold flavoprotein